MRTGKKNAFVSKTNIFILLIPILINLGCKQKDLIILSEEPNASEITIGKGNVGHLRIGTGLSLLRLKFASKIEEILLQNEAEEPALKYTFENGKSVVLEFDEAKKYLWSIRIEDKFFKTSGGVGVGTTFKEILNAFPTHKVTFGLEEGAYLSIVVPEISGYFSFPTGELQDQWFESEKPDLDKVAKFKANIIIIGRGTTLLK